MELKIFCDGGARGNPGPAAIGVVICDVKGQELAHLAKRIGKATNNFAEYQAVIEALNYLHKKKNHLTNLLRIQCNLDSELVVSQLNRLFKIKNSDLRLQYAKVRQLESEVKVLIYYRTIPRSQNSRADALVNQALDQGSNILLETSPQRFIS